MTNEKRLWDWLRVSGLTEEGAAGLIGNLYAESGLDPGKCEQLCLNRLKEAGVGEYTSETYTAAVDDGRISREEFLHPLPGRQYGYGLAQWTTESRKSGLYDMIKTLGVSIADFEAQAAYLIWEIKNRFESVWKVLISTKDVNEASDTILMKFECPANAEAMKGARRGYSMNTLIHCHEEVKVTERDIIICGHGSGNPSTKNMFSYLSDRYAQKAANGVRKGVVCVRRRKDLTEGQRQAFHDTFRTILGRNIYNQNRRAYVYEKYPDTGKYYSDCSSAGMATLNLLGISTGGLLNTAGIYQSSLFEDVPVKMAEGHILDPEILQVGDAILFAGNDPERPKQIGHVEYVYEFPNSWEPEVYPRWVYDKEKWYRREAAGVNAHGWRDINHHRYWFDDKGVMATDWKEIEGKWYYFHPTRGAQFEGALYHQADETGALEIWTM